MKHTLALFLKTGCVVCIFLLLCLAAVHHFKPALSSLPVFSRFERKLPIYCVDTDKPQVAISFDAAWGNEDTETLLSILDKYNALPISQARKMRFLFANAAKCEPDKQGRFLIPTELRDYAGLKDEVMFVGLAGHAEIWDSATYDALEAETLTPEYMASVMEELDF